MTSVIVGISEVLINTWKRKQKGGKKETGIILGVKLLKLPRY